MQLNNDEVHLVLSLLSRRDRQHAGYVSKQWYEVSKRFLSIPLSLRPIGLSLFIKGEPSYETIEKSSQVFSVAKTDKGPKLYYVPQNLKNENHGVRLNSFDQMVILSYLRGYLIFCFSNAKHVVSQWIKPTNHEFDFNLFFSVSFLQYHQVAAASWMLAHENRERTKFFSSFFHWPYSSTDIYCDFGHFSMKKQGTRRFKEETSLVSFTDSAVFDYSVKINGGWFCDEVGFGKSVSLLALVSHQKPQSFPNNSLQNSNATLIVCSNSIASQWYNEKKKFFPNMKCILLFTLSHWKKINSADICGADIIIVTFQFLRNENYSEIVKKGEPNLQDYFFCRLIVDEAHEITSIIDPIFSLSAVCKWCCTATPFTSTEQIYCLLAIVIGRKQLLNICPPLHSFKLKHIHIFFSLIHFMMKENMWRSETTNSFDVEKIETKVVDYSKTQIENDFSWIYDIYPGQCIPQFISMKIPHMSQKYISKIDTFVKENSWQSVVERFDPFGSEEKENINFFCSFLEDNTKIAEYYGGHVAEFTKLIISLLKDPEFTGLIFSRHSRCLQLVTAICHHYGFPVSKFNGSVHSKTKKLKIVKSKRGSVTLLDMKTNFSGINLQEITKVILLDPNTSKTTSQQALEKQAIGRCWRQGQNQIVTVYRFERE